MPTRRRALQATAALLALAAFSGGAAIEVAQLGPPAPGCFCLSQSELHLVQALAEALFPPGNALGVSAVDLDLALEIDELIGDRLDPVVTPVFRYALEALDRGTWVSRGARFVDLPLEDRVAVLARWAEPGVLARRMTYDALRTVVGMVFFSREEVTAAIGWQPACAARGIGAIGPIHQAAGRDRAAADGLAGGAGLARGEREAP